MNCQSFSENASLLLFGKKFLFFLYKTIICSPHFLTGFPVSVAQNLLPLLESMYFEVRLQNRNPFTKSTECIRHSSCPIASFHLVRNSKL